MGIFITVENGERSRERTVLVVGKGRWGMTIMIKEEYHRIAGMLSAYDELSDGAWFASCEHACGGYDKFMAWLEAGKTYEPDTIIEGKDGA